jgi:hypothetical protein
VGTAGLAGAAGVTGVALSRRNSPSIIRTVDIAHQSLSAVLTLQFAWENVDLGGTCTTNYAGSGPGAGLDFYLLCLIGLPTFLQMGTYTLDVTQQFTPNGMPPNPAGPIQTSGTATLPWEYSSAPNPVLLAKSGAFTTACVTTGLPTVPPALPGSSLPFTFAIGPLGDLALFFIHVVYHGNPPVSGDSTVFTGAFSGTVAPSTPISGAGSITVAVP